MLDGISAQKWPSDLALERQVLASMMGFPFAAAFSRQALRPSDFYSPLYGKLFEVLLRSMVDGSVDRVLAYSHVRDSEDLKEALQSCDLGFGFGLLYEERVEGACQRLRDLAVLRKTAEAAIRIAGRLLNERAEDINGVIDWATGQMTDALASREVTQNSRSLEQIVGEIIQDILEPPADAPCISTPIDALSRQLNGGFHRGQQYVIAGRPGSGKTSFALECAMRAAESGKRVLVYSYEMKDRRLVERMIASRSNIGGSLLRQPSRLAEQQKALLIREGIRLAKEPMQVEQSAGWTIDQLARHAKQEHMKRGVDLICVDYAQLVKTSGKRSREEEVAATSAEVHELAMRLNVPTLLLAQVNREVDKRANKQPVLSDLRESGALEQDADCVLFTWRGEGDQAEIVVGKNRDGETGSIPVRFESQYTRFVDVNA